MAEMHDGIWIRDLRRRLGLSQIELAARLGISNVTVNRWERGRVTPEISTIRRLLQIEQQIASHDTERSSGASTGNLPVIRNRFVGRGDLLADLATCFREHALVSLVGTAGSGKTRLAIELGHRVEPVFADGVWFVDLSTLTDDRLIPGEIASALGIRLAGREPALDRIAGRLEGSTRLLMLDNCEHLLDGAAETAAELIARLPKLRVLATSRAALRLPSERVVQLGRLPLAAAVQLFQDRAGQMSPAIAAWPGDETLEALCTRLDCLPLAIELAAARSSAMTPRQMLDRIDDRFALLGSHSGGARQATLKTALDWSHDLLSATERAVFRRLGAFAGEFDLESAESVCADESLSAWNVVAAIEQLLRHSLLTPIESADSHESKRFVMLESIRAYARDRLDDAGERSVTHERHAARLLQIARNAGARLHRDEHRASLARLDREHDDVIQALLWALDRRDSEIALALTAAMWPAWQARGRFAEGASWLESALSIAAEPCSIAHAETLGGAAMLRMRLGEHDLAREHARRALSVWRALGNAPGQAAMLDLLGLIAQRSGELAECERLHALAADLTANTDDEPGIVRNLTMLGQLANTRGDTVQADRLYTDAWSIARRLGDLEAQAALLLDLGDVAAREGRFQQSVSFYEQSLALNERLGNPDRAAAIVSNLAEVRMNTGDVARAVEQARDGAERFRRLGNRAHLADALYVLGAALRAARRDSESLGAFRDALGIYIDLGNEVYAAHALEPMADIATSHGLTIEAARLFGGAQAIRARAGVSPYALFDYAGALARLEARIGPERMQTEMAQGAAYPFARLALLAISLALEPIAKEQPAAETPPADALLTERQIEVLRLVAAGLSNRAIAAELSISERTVERHLSGIYLALEVDRRSSAVAYAVANGLHRADALTGSLSVLND